MGLRAGHNGGRSMNNSKEFFLLGVKARTPF